MRHDIGKQQVRLDRRARLEALTERYFDGESSGPDIVSNGLALSGTAHWMFDRGLISLDDDFRIIVSRHVNDPDSARGLINGSGRAIVPPRPSDRPSPHFLKWHREHVFKA